MWHCCKPCLAHVPDLLEYAVNLWSSLAIQVDAVCLVVTDIQLLHASMCILLHCNVRCPYAYRGGYAMHSVCRMQEVQWLPLEKSLCQDFATDTCSSITSWVISGGTSSCCLTGASSMTVCALLLRHPTQTSSRHHEASLQIACLCTAFAYAGSSKCSCLCSTGTMLKCVHHG